MKICSGLLACVLAAKKEMLFPEKQNATSVSLKKEPIAKRNAEKRALFQLVLCLPLYAVDVKRQNQITAANFAQSAMLML
ncbi:MAG: hypothetical protein ACI4XF_11725 [Oscillospiraceae bacterium]